MLIFSRSRSPWVAFAFILVVAVGAFMRFQQSAENEEAQLKIDQAGFVEFKQDLTALKIPEKTLNSRTLFEVYRCGMGSITERNYCAHLGDEFFGSLTDEQKKAIRLILEKHFNKH